jgi:CMP-N-acetylneuraminic acid synthetase
MSDCLVALVPMKAHSERVPDKNVREFNGKPLFHWILAALEATDVVNKIVVNTDSEHIAREARERFAVEIIDRPNELRGDTVSMNEIIGHDIGAVDADLYLQTHCTNPMLRPETIEEAVERYRTTDCDSLFSVTPLQTRLWDVDGEPINHRREELLPTQDLDPVYEEDSNLYLFTRESFTKHKNRIGAEPTMLLMDAEEAVDIDYPIDFKMAEFFHRDRYGDSPSLEEVLTT